MSRHSQTSSVWVLRVVIWVMVICDWNYTVTTPRGLKPIIPGPKTHCNIFHLHTRSGKFNSVHMCCLIWCHRFEMCCHCNCGVICISRCFNIFIYFLRWKGVQTWGGTSSKVVQKGMICCEDFGQRKLSCRISNYHDTSKHPTSPLQ